MKAESPRTAIELLGPLAFPIGIYLIASAGRHVGPLSIPREPCPLCLLLYLLVALHVLVAGFLVGRARGRRALYIGVSLIEFLITLWAAFVGHMALTGLWL